MKNTIIKLLLCLLAISLTPELAQAQLGGLQNRIKNRVKNRIENKIESKLDKAVDDVLDGKPSNRNTNTNNQQSNTNNNTRTMQEEKTTSRSKETGGYENPESEEQQRLRYLYKTTVAGCASFLNFRSGHGFRPLDRDEEYVALRKEMTAAKMKNMAIPLENDRNAIFISQLDECRKYVDDADFEESAFDVIDRTYMQYDKEEAYKNLVDLSDDFNFISNVVVTNNSKLQKVTAYAEKLRDKLGTKNSAAMDKIACSAFHKQNMDKIFFTSNPNIDPTTATASSFKTNFKAGEDIYGVVYFKSKIQKYMDGTQHILSGDLTLNNNTRAGSMNVDYHGKLDYGKSYAVFVIYADASRYQNKSGSTFPTVPLNAEFLSKLPPRNHKIVANVGREAKGTFEFDASDDNGLTSMATTAKKLRNRLIANKKIPKAGMKNASIEKQLVAMFNSIGWSEKFKKAVITSSDYGYQRSVTGRITGRTLSVLMFSTKSDGTCMYQDFTVVQPKTGSGYGAFRRLSTGGQSDIGCDKL